MKSIFERSEFFYTSVKSNQFTSNDEFNALTWLLRRKPHEVQNRPIWLLLD